MSSFILTGARGSGLNCYLIPGGTEGLDIVPIRLNVFSVMEIIPPIPQETGSRWENGN